MAIGILGPLNEVINKTAAEIIDGQISAKLAKIFNTFVNASFEAADSALVKLRDLTKKETTGEGSP